MEHNFDFPSIQAYQAKIVGEINSQIGTLTSEQSSLTTQQANLTTQQTNLNNQLTALSRLSSSDSSEAAQKAAQISQITAQLEVIAAQLTAIAARLSTIGTQITTLQGAIEETNAFVDGLTTRISNTDLTYAEKLRQINEAIQTYTNNMRDVTSILYPPIGNGVLTGPLTQNIQGIRATNFMNILANMTKTSYGYTMIGCINGNIDGRISNTDIATATKEALGIANLKDASQLLAWAQTLGMASSEDIVSLISDGTLGYMGINSDQASLYRAELETAYNSSLIAGPYQLGTGPSAYSLNLGNCLKQIYELPHQNPAPGATIVWNNYQDFRSIADLKQEGENAYNNAYNQVIQNGGTKNDAISAGSSAMKEIYSYQIDTSRSDRITYTYDNTTGKYTLTGNAYIHTGTDFAGSFTVYAANGGFYSTSTGGLSGNMVSIKGEDNVTDSYAHLNNFESNLAPGQLILPGQNIGVSGNTGNSGGTHLHFENQNANGRWGSAANSQSPYNRLP